MMETQTILAVAIAFTLVWLWFLRTNTQVQKYMERERRYGRTVTLNKVGVIRFVVMYITSTIALVAWCYLTLGVVMR